MCSLWRLSSTEWHLVVIRKVKCDMGMCKNSLKAHLVEVGQETLFGRSVVVVSYWTGRMPNARSCCKHDVYKTWEGCLGVAVNGVETSSIMFGCGNLIHQPQVLDTCCSACSLQTPLLSISRLCMPRKENSGACVVWRHFCCCIVSPP